MAPSRFVASLIDRLDSQNPAAARDSDSPAPAPAARWSAEQFRDAVLRDLEHLLNTRNTFADLVGAFQDQGFVEASRSVLTYGLPDFSSHTATLGVDGPKIVGDPFALAAAIEQAIAFFEPRLVDVAVTVPPPPPPDKTTGRPPAVMVLRMRVDARLRLDAVKENIAFDIAMPLSTYGYEVKDAR